MILLQSSCSVNIKLKIMVYARPRRRHTRSNAGLCYWGKKRLEKKISQWKNLRMIDIANYRRKFIRETRVWVYRSQNGFLEKQLRMSGGRHVPGVWANPQPGLAYDPTSFHFLNCHILGAWQLPPEEYHRGKPLPISFPDIRLKKRDYECCWPPRTTKCTWGSHDVSSEVDFNRLYHGDGQLTVMGARKEKWCNPTFSNLTWPGLKRCRCP